MTVAWRAAAIRVEVRVELVLAEIAAVGGIRPVFLAIHFVRVDDFVPEGEPLGDIDREPAMMFGIARAVGGDGDGAVPERAAGGVRQIRAVDAPAVGDDDRAERGQHVTERLGLFRSAGSFVRHHSSTLVLLVLFFLVFVVLEVVFLQFLVVVVIVVIVVRGDVELDGRNAGHFEAGAALRAAQLIALVDIEFVDLDFGVAFRAVGHNLPRSLPGPSARGAARV